MKKIISGLTAGCVFAALLFTGCSDSDDGDSGVVTKPVVKFETASDANLVKAVITSDIDLKSVVVSTSWGTGADAHSETVATNTSFDTPLLSALTSTPRTTNARIRSSRTRFRRICSTMR